MFDSISRRVPWVIVAIMALAVTGVPATAQTDDGMDPAAVSNVNAHRVDGRHAVKMTSNVDLRAGRLMAFSGRGYLPANIVEGGVATIAALQSSAGAVNEADNPVHWNQIQGVPPAVMAGDKTLSFIAAESPVIAVAGVAFLIVDHPVGLEVETTLIPTATGATVIEGTNVAADISRVYARMDANTIREFQIFQVFGVASTVKLRATVWNDSYLSPAAAKSKVKASFATNPKRALKRLGIK